jgi:hypothetical protein
MLSGKRFPFLRDQGLPERHPVRKDCPEAPESKSRSDRRHEFRYGKAFAVDTLNLPTGARFHYFVHQE